MDGSRRACLDVRRWTRRAELARGRTGERLATWASVWTQRLGELGDRPPHGCRGLWHRVALRQFLGRGAWALSGGTSADGVGRGGARPVPVLDLSLPSLARPLPRAASPQTDLRNDPALRLVGFHVGRRSTCGLGSRLAHPRAWGGRLGLGALLHPEPRGLWGHVGRRCVVLAGVGLLRVARPRQDRLVRAPSAL